MTDGAQRANEANHRRTVRQTLARIEQNVDRLIGMFTEYLDTKAEELQRSGGMATPWILQRTDPHAHEYVGYQVEHGPYCQLCGTPKSVIDAEPLTREGEEWAAHEAEEG